MRKILLGSAILVAVCVAAVVWTGFSSPERAAVSPGMKQVQRLQLALYLYALDAQEAADGRPRPLPGTLEDLVRYGFLAREELEAATKDGVIYHRPQGFPQLGEVVLELPGKDGTVVLEWESRVYLRETEKP